MDDVRLVQGLEPEQDAARVEPRRRRTHGAVPFHEVVEIAARVVGQEQVRLGRALRREGRGGEGGRPCGRAGKRFARRTDNQPCDTATKPPAPPPTPPNRPQPSWPSRLISRRTRSAAASSSRPTRVALSNTGEPSAASHSSRRLRQPVARRCRGVTRAMENSLLGVDMATLSNEVG